MMTFDNSKPYYNGYKQEHSPWDLKVDEAVTEIKEFTDSCFLFQCVVDFLRVKKWQFKGYFFIVKAHGWCNIS